MTDTEILDWLIANDVIAVGNFMGGDMDRVRTASGCGCCTDTLDTPPDVLARLTTPQENVEEPKCRTCGGTGFCGVWEDDSYDEWECPDCTPENVECRTCGGSGMIPPRSEPHPQVPGFCLDCVGTGITPPDDVEEPK